MIRTLGALVGAAAKADALATSLERRLDEVRAQTAANGRAAARLFRGVGRADDLRHPLGAELIEVAGGIEAFPELSLRKNAKDRIVTADDVIAARPDIIVGSWCGKKFVPAKVAARPGFDAIPAVRDGSCARSSRR